MCVQTTPGRPLQIDVDELSAPAVATEVSDVRVAGGRRLPQSVR